MATVRDLRHEREPAPKDVPNDAVLDSCLRNNRRISRRARKTRSRACQESPGEDANGTASASKVPSASRDRGRVGLAALPYYCGTYYHFRAPRLLQQVSSRY